MTQTSFSGHCGPSRRGGFTLLQIVVTIGLIAILSTILVGQFGQSRAGVRRAECDVHLKEIVLAMDTFRQETGSMPLSLLDLKTRGYVPIDTLRCSADPTLAAQRKDLDYSSYADTYVLRDARDDDALPVIVCPWHEKDGSHGVQGFKAGYTSSFAARPATLGAIEGSVTVTRPGEGVLEVPASGQLPVRGGDRIRMGSGTATLTFADGSAAKLQSNSEMSVLESYREGQNSDSLYTLVRQFAGTINYSVVSGNKFDVATPTATAGALGTEFSIQLVPALTVPERINSSVNAPLETLLVVTEHVVALTSRGRTIEVDVEDTAGVRSDDPANSAKPRAPRDAKVKKTKKGKEDKKDKDKDKDKD